MSRFLLLACCLIAIGTEALIPDGYIMKVIPYCGSSIDDNPYIDVITDLQARVHAVCSNGEFEFNNTDTVNFYLPVSYRGRNSGLCEFTKRALSLTYVVKLIISYGEPGQLVSQDDEEITVSCTFDPRKSKEAGTQNVVDTLVAPPEIQGYEGNLAVDSVLTLDVTDVLDNDITGQDMDLGRWVRLKATTDGGSGEVSIRPIACDIVGENTGKRYSVIRAGCGDGVVFNKTDGFTISGNISTSPYFQVFDMADDQEFSFVCNFTLCDTNCDGSSCAQERTRRDTLTGASHVTNAFIPLETRYIRFRQPSWSVPGTR